MEFINKLVYFHSGNHTLKWCLHMRENSGYLLMPLVIAIGKDRKVSNKIGSLSDLGLVCVRAFKISVHNCPIIKIAKQSAI